MPHLKALSNLVENLVDAITIDTRSSRASIDFYGLLKNSRYSLEERVTWRLVPRFISERAEPACDSILEDIRQRQRKWWR
jgi:hypothetical protein